MNLKNKLNGSFSDILITFVKVILCDLWRNIVIEYSTVEPIKFYLDI